MASTFWKKTIHGAISCVQPTRFDSSSCSLKLPAVWKNFRGTSGARRRTSASACRGPASSAPPRSKYSRIEPTASSTTSSPSTRPVLPSSNVTSFKPGKHLLRVLVRREHRVEDLRDRAALDEQRDAPVEDAAAKLERRQPQRGAEAALGIGDHGIRDPVAFRELDLLRVRLSREARHLPVERSELARVIAEGARLRRATARAGNRVPLRPEGLIRLSRPRVDVQDEPVLRERAEGDRPLRRLERQLRQHPARQLVGGPVVRRHREV